MQEDTQVQSSTEVQAEGVRIAVTIPREIDRAIEKEAANRDVTKSRLVSDALALFLSGLQTS